MFRRQILFWGNRGRFEAIIGRAPLVEAPGHTNLLLVAPFTEQDESFRIFG